MVSGCNEVRRGDHFHVRQPCIEQFWKQCPFFLVTHKSLVEAQTEAAIAQNSVDQLRSGCGDSVTVKCDEVTSRVVAIAALPSAAVLDAATAV